MWPARIIYQVGLGCFFIAQVELKGFVLRCVCCSWRQVSISTSCWTWSQCAAQVGLEFSLILLRAGITDVCHCVQLNWVLSVSKTAANQAVFSGTVLSYAHHGWTDTANTIPLEIENTHRWFPHTCENGEYAHPLHPQTRRESFPMKRCFSSAQYFNSGSASKNVINKLANWFFLLWEIFLSLFFFLHLTSTTCFIQKACLPYKIKLENDWVCLLFRPSYLPSGFYFYSTFFFSFSRDTFILRKATDKNKTDPELPGNKSS